jgi:phospholipid transport system substrate-binding protein
MLLNAISNQVRKPLGHLGLSLAISLSSVVSLSLAPALVGATAAWAQTAVPADEFIKTISTDAIDKISKDKDIQAGDIKRLSDLVDSTIMPNVNFERMTALAVGRGWRQATPEQQKRLMSEFRILLLRTYSGALSAVKDQSVRMKPFRAEASESDVVVRTEVVPKRGDAIQLDYRVEKAGNSWKIYDLNVLGVWLVETYRNQFAQEVSNKGIDGLIQSLSDKNKSFAGEKKG